MITTEGFHLFNSEIKYMRHEDAVKRREAFSERHPIGPDDAKAPMFYQQIIRDFPVPKTGRKIVFVVVAHLVHTFPYFLELLSTLGLIKWVIPKQSSCVPRVMDTINKLYEDILRPDITKELLQTDCEEVKKFLQILFDTDADVVFIDHGGYFSALMPFLKQFKNFFGIVEHTWNGEIKYLENLLSQFSSLFSIARTPLKALEDVQVAKSIVYSMRTKVFGGEGMNQDMSRLHIGIIGFGHLGKAIALLLKSEGHSATSIVDNSEKARTDAALYGFDTVSSDFNALPEKPDVVIIATSAKSLTQSVVAGLKNGACIVCVTSCDDLFTKDALGNYVKDISASTDTISKYMLNGKIIYLAADGRSVNFLIGSTAHPILHAVLVAVYVSVLRLMQHTADNSMQVISQEDQDLILNDYENFYAENNKIKTSQLTPALFSKRKIIMAKTESANERCCAMM